MTTMNQRRVLGTTLHAIACRSAAHQVLRWAEERRSGYVVAANVHVLMEAYDSSDFHRAVNGADFILPDGMPVVWAMKALGLRGATRVYGPTLMLTVCELAAESDIPIGLYGGTRDSLHELEAYLLGRFPRLDVVTSIPPPFRALTAKEDEAYVNEIIGSGARIVFVGIGCPKQERWMAAHRGCIPAVMLGVGAAFDFHSGRVRQAPRWLQNAGLEWLFRLVHEPRRLWKRYLKHNPRFVALLMRQLVTERYTKVR